MKALKLLLHDIQSGGESATIPIAPDDDDKDWSDAESDDGGRGREFEYLSDLVGPKGLAFDNDDLLDTDDDEDLKDDPISQMNMQVGGNTVFFHLVLIPDRNTSSHSSENVQIGIRTISPILYNSFQRRRSWWFRPFCNSSSNDTIIKIYPGFYEP